MTISRKVRKVSTTRTKSTPRGNTPKRRQNTADPTEAHHTGAALEATRFPREITQWFETRGWSPRSHQLALLDAAQRRQSTLLIAPTGAGKTLAGFLPSIATEIERGRARPPRGLRTLYISPLKALAADVHRNLSAPLTDMGLKLRAEMRTGDTSAAIRARQRTHPPHILLTTPEQIALLLSHPDAGQLFAELDTIILDELHALAGSKRGDLLALDLARLRNLAPAAITFGLSATVAYPSELRAYLVPQRAPDKETALANLVMVSGGAAPNVSLIKADAPAPWSGHTARYAMRDVYNTIRQHKLAIIFVNTRMQAELSFQELWRINDDNLPIGLHHGSLDTAQRRKVEAAMANGELRAVVATSTLDLGIDWGDIDIVIHLGAPKGSSRLLQRIGRANHRLDEPSRALLVPGNRFEVLECQAAREAVDSGHQDTGLSRTGALDVLAQHVLGMACQSPFSEAELYTEVRSALPYRNLSRTDFDRVVNFVSTGGYALSAYERFAKLRPTDDGRLRVANARIAQQYRLNIGTIVDTPLLKVRLVSSRMPQKTFTGGRVLGEIDEAFAEQLPPRATFVFAGEILRFEGLVDTNVFVSRTDATDPMIPSYGGGRFPMSTHLAARVRAMLASPEQWPALPADVAEWLALQQQRSALPRTDEVLIETFPRQKKHYLVAYPFEGRLAHQTLGMLLTRRLDRAGASPLGFVANDYALSIWCRTDINQMIDDGRLRLDDLFDQDMLGDDLDAWLAESSLMKRTFRNVAVIAGLIERRHPGRQKSGRQVTMSTDLVYDVLRRHEPGHILLSAAWADAATGLLDIARLGEFLARTRGRIRHQPLQRVSPLAVPILLEIGRETVRGTATEDMLRDAAAALIDEAIGD